jgi:hypothetical protein
MSEIYRERFPDDPYETQRFSYFVEYERSEKIKNSIRSRGKTIHDFCDWVGTGRLPRAENVRRLPDILADDTATDRFLDENSQRLEENYERALEYLSIAKPGSVSPLFQRVEDVIHHLQRITFYEIEDIRASDQPERRLLLQRLADISSKIWRRVSEEDSDSEDAS